MLTGIIVDVATGADTGSGIDTVGGAAQNVWDNLAMARGRARKSVPEATVLSTNHIVSFFNKLNLGWIL